MRQKCRLGDDNERILVQIFKFYQLIWRKKKFTENFLKQMEMTPCWIDKIYQNVLYTRIFFIAIHKKA